MLTPEQVHFGEAPKVIEHRQGVLAAAYAVHPERFVAGPPQAGALSEQVWINPPLPVSAVDGPEGQGTTDGPGREGGSLN